MSNELISAVSSDISASNGCFGNIADIKEYFKFAAALSDSNIIPDTFRGKPGDVLIALDMAQRLGFSPLLIMQSLYVVHGKPAWSGSFCSSLIIGSGLFKSFRYIETDLPEDVPQLGRKNRSCFIEAVPVDDPEHPVTGTVIDLKMAVSEGWASKPGSKWKTMPEQMLKYRAATFFARTYCAAALMGIRTQEEIEDIDNAYTSYRSETKKPSSKKGVKTFEELIQRSEDREALKKIGMEIKEANLPESETEGLRDMFSEKNAEFAKKENK